MSLDSGKGPSAGVPAGSKVPPLEVLIQQAYNAAVKLLAFRDHSVFELNRKLVKREHSAEAIEGALEELLALNYVNDARYADTYAEQRLRKGFGPLSVIAKLRERGLEPHLIDAALRSQKANWAELAQIQIEKRFDAEAILSRETRIESRLARFLAHRGFSASDSLRALKAARKAITS